MLQRKQARIDRFQLVCDCDCDLLRHVNGTCDFEPFEAWQADGQDGAAHGDILEGALVVLEPVVQKMVIHFLIALPAHEMLAYCHGFCGDGARVWQA